MFKRTPWEDHGRGIIVLNCSKPLKWPVNSEETAIVDLREDVSDMKNIARLVIPFIPSRALYDSDSLNWLVNKILLPAYWMKKPCYLGFEADASDFDMRSMKIQKQEDLDRAYEQIIREQVWSLIRRMCILIPNPDYLNYDLDVSMTPIEKQLSESFQKLKIDYKAQKQIGRRRVDFAITLNDGKLLVVEADGREFHDPERDAIRDQKILAEPSIKEIIHFTGSQIFHQSDDCAGRVSQIIKLLNEDVPLSKGRNIPIKPDLSTEQKVCLKPLQGIVLTLAPAGSGKTRVLSRRVNEYVRSGLPENRILCVVFNVDAREVMEVRIHEEMGLKNVGIQNIHRTGCAIVQKSKGSPYYGFKVIQTSDFEYRKLFRDIIRDSKKELGQSDLYVPQGQLEECLEFTEHYKRTLAIPESIGEYGFDSNTQFLIMKKVDKLLFDRDQITFDDQIFLAVQLLFAYPRTRNFFWNRYDAVLADEFQDLTPMQFSLVRLISMPLNNLFAVGDDDQMIYSFLSADPRNIRDFEKLFTGSVKHTLGENWRSTPEIVIKSANLISYNLMRHDKHIRPADKYESSHPDSLSIVKNLETNLEISTIISKLKRWREEGFDYKEMAVLVRVSNLAGLLQPSLDEAGIPYRVIGGSSFYTSVHGKLIWVYLKLISDPEMATSDQISLCLKTPSKSLKHQLCNQLGDSGWHGMRQLFSRLESWQQEKLQTFINEVEKLNNIINSKGYEPQKIYQMMIRVFAIDALYEEDDAIIANTGIVTGREFVRMIEEQSKSYDTFQSFVDAYHLKMKNEEQSLKVQRKKAEDEVQIKTIHKSKGEEFSCVIIFHVDEGILPHQRALDTGWQQAEEEERRVFYVAITRAIKRLLITTGTNPSRFIEELQISRKDRDELAREEQRRTSERQIGQKKQRGLLARVISFLKDLFN